MRREDFGTIVEIGDVLVSEDVMKYILFAVLPVAAFFVLNRHLFQDRGREAVADRTHGVRRLAFF